MDKIFINEMVVDTIIGIYPHERENKQAVTINIEIDCDLAKAGETDKLEDTVNYKDINDKVRQHVSNSDYLLIEKMAASIASICFETIGVEAVKVGIEKPEALEGNRSVVSRYLEPASPIILLLFFIFSYIINLRCLVML